MRRLAGFLILAAIGAGRVSAGTAVIHAGQLLAVPGEQPLAEQTVVIDDGRVKAVLAGYREVADLAPGAEYLDLKDRFLMPGLIDSHVHLQGELGPDKYADAVLLSREDVAMRSLMYGRRTLEAGFTTVRDCGSDPQTIYAYRKAVERGWVAGPRIVAAGAVGPTGGHVDADGMSHELLDLFTDERMLCDGADECRKATRQQIKYGADLIKVASTGGVLSDTDTGTGQQMTDEELRAIVDAAHALGRKVASHAHAAEGINAALRAGVDSIEHGTWADAESYALFRKTGAYLVPTLLAGQTVYEMAQNSAVLSSAQREKALEVGAAMRANIGRALKAGVRVAFGTDTGVSRHGENAREAVLMVEAGMAPSQVLVAATLSAADLLGRPSLGRIAPGMAADMIGLSASPLEDIHELLDVDFVMKGGEVFKRK